MRMTADQHKSFGAAVAATGAASMYAYEPTGSKDRRKNRSYDEIIDFDASDVERCAEELAGGGDWDLVAIGCPHCSVGELRRMASKLKGRKPSGRCDVWFCTSRKAYAQCPEAVAVLRRFGKVLCDTCMVVAPIEELYGETATDSGKAAVYLPTLGRQRTSYRSNKQLLEAISR